MRTWRDRPGRELERRSRNDVVLKPPARLRPIVEEIEPRIYVYFLQSAYSQLGIFEGTGYKTTIPNLSRSRLAALEVPQPNIDGQLAIVVAVLLVRKAIHTHDQSVELAQGLKRAAMRTLFTRGLRDEVQKETEMGLVPNSWEIRSLGTLCNRSDKVDLRHERGRVIEFVDVASVFRKSLSIEST